MKNIEKKEISVKIKNVNVYFNKEAHMLLQKELIPMIEANLPNMAYAEKRHCYILFKTATSE